jgi:ABC-type proline/glycine betaine transport system permease subunit
VFIALVFAIPIGIFAGLHAEVNRYVQVAVDVIQTIPPYVYLLPGVALIGGPDFGTLGEGFIRVSYAASEEQIQEALSRMKGFLET